MQPEKILYPFECLLLSGMPGTGKDALTQKLVERDPTFTFFKKHRALSSPLQSDEETYINVSPEAFLAIAHSNGFIQYHHRYEKMYGVAKEAYEQLIQAAKIPIIHVGKYENLLSLRKGGLQKGLSLLLYADRHIVQSRLYERHKIRTDGAQERLLAYDEEVAQLQKYMEQGELDFDLYFVNNGSDINLAADQLLSFLRSATLSPKKRLNEQISYLLAR